MKGDEAVVGDCAAHALSQNPLPLFYTLLVNQPVAAENEAGVKRKEAAISQLAKLLAKQEKTKG